MDPVVLRLGLESVAFEVVCNQLERRFCDADLDLVCRCCAEEMADSVCKSCRHALGFHLCRKPNNTRQHLLWREGTLDAGVRDDRVAAEKSYLTRRESRLLPDPGSNVPHGG